MLTGGSLGASPDPSEPPTRPHSPSLCRHHAEPGDRQLHAKTLGAKAVPGPLLQGLSLKAFSEGQPPSTFQVTYHFPFSHSPWQGPSRSSRGQESDSAPQPPPQTHKLARSLALEKGWFSFLSFPPAPSNTLPCLSLGSFSHGPPWSGPGDCGQPFSILSRWRVPPSGQAVRPYCAWWERGWTPEAPAGPLLYRLLLN